MTVLHETDEVTVDEIVTPEDMRAAYRSALELAGCSMAELRRQGRTGHFDTLNARLAWMALS